MKTHLKYLTLFICFSLTPTYAEKLLPRFSGQWYTYTAASAGPGSINGNVDSCGSIIKYTVPGNSAAMGEGPSADAALQQGIAFWQATATAWKCTIAKVEYEGTGSAAPIDFPSRLEDKDGKRVDFDAILTGIFNYTSL